MEDDDEDFEALFFTEWLSIPLKAALRHLALII